MPTQLAEVDAIRIGRMHVEPDFAVTDRFNDDWWFRPIVASTTIRWFALIHDAEEICRVEIRFDCDWPDHYPVPESPGGEVVTIDFFEVAEGCRKQGYGSAAVRGLRSRYPAATFLAYSEGADGFWRSLGWEEYNAHSMRPLFIGYPKE